MADKADMAAGVQELLDDALRHALPTNPTRPDHSGDGCLDCGEPIPPARMRAMAGCCLCIECQEHFEARQFR